MAMAIAIALEIGAALFMLAFITYQLIDINRILRGDVELRTFLRDRIRFWMERYDDPNKPKM